MKVWRERSDRLGLGVKRFVFLRNYFQYKTIGALRLTPPEGKNGLRSVSPVHSRLIPLVILTVGRSLPRRSFPPLSPEVIIHIMALLALIRYPHPYPQPKQLYPKVHEGWLLTCHTAIPDSKRPFHLLPSDSWPKASSRGLSRSS